VTLAADTTANNALSSGYITLDSDKSFSAVDSATGAFFGTAATNATLNSVAAVDVSTYTGANSALKVVDAALAFLNSERAKLGALQSRFESTVSNNQAAAENLTASRGRIQDADFAKETAALSRAQVLQQAANAMLAQANQAPQQVLQLLRGG
jgi:flagellin